MKTITPIINKTFCRYVFLIISAICSIPLYAQNNVQATLDKIYEWAGEEPEKGLSEILAIDTSDITNWPDSTKFDYHYMVGYLYGENAQPEMSIKHLLEAKNMCDKTLGTYSIGYMEIMRGLGDLYMDKGQYEEALAVFQEGIVKSMTIRSAATHAFGNLIIGMSDCYEQMGWFYEVPTHLRDAWDFWPKDEKPFETYNYYPLWALHQFYWRYEMYDEALKVSDQILDFITKQVGGNHSEMAEALYMRGNTLVAMKRANDAVEVFENAISILKSNKKDKEELYGMICGNLLSSYIEAGLTDYEPILKDIKDFGTRTKNTSIFKNALYSSASIFNKKGDYTTALALNQEVSEQNLTREEKTAVENQRKEITYNHDVIEALPKLEQQRGVLAKGSVEWFENQHQLSSAYYLVHEQDKNLDVLSETHQACIDSPAIGEEYLIWVLNNLLGLYLEQGAFDNALKCAIEKWEYVSSKANMPDNILFDALNNLIVAKTKAGKLDGIDDELKRIREYYRKQFGEKSQSYAMFLHNRGRAYQLQGNLEDAKQTLLQAIALQTELEGKPMGRTVQYLIEVQKQLNSQL